MRLFNNLIKFVLMTRSKVSDIQQHVLLNINISKPVGISSKVKC